MSKTYFRAVLMIALIPCAVIGQAPANYEVTINGERHDVTLGVEYETELKSGEKITFSVEKKKIVLYEDQFLSFNYNSEMTLASTDLGEGVNQIVTNTALGTMIIIQEYPSMNPSLMTDLMIQELTKGDVNYGYTMKEEPWSIILKDGSELIGKKATLTYQQKEKYWAALAFGKKDTGILIVTGIEEGNMKAEQKVIDLFWESLQIRF